MLNGYATPAGTQAFAEQHVGLAFSHIPQMNLTVSAAGFGGYRVTTGVDPHKTALQQSILSGINLIDTSTNYGDGGSEQLIGMVLAELVGSGQLEREQIVVVSKAGYLQGSNYQLSQARKREGEPFPELVEYMQGLEHCLHPDFLGDQISRSLSRLGMATLDVLLLHNPEYYLSWALREGIELATARAEYNRRIKVAFEYLESEVEADRIRAYGVSSNTFTAPADDAEFSSLSRMLQLAKEVNPTPFFHMIQLPMNLCETGAVTERNQPDTLSCLEVAADNQVAVLINRPLNAIQGSHLLRLADVAAVDSPTHTEVSTAVDTFIAVESDLITSILTQLDLPPDIDNGLRELATTGQLIAERWPQFETFTSWQDIQKRALIPRFNQTISMLSSKAASSEPTQQWLGRYAEAVNGMLQSIGLFHQAKSAATAQAMKAKAIAADAEWDSATLSQVAVRALRSTVGVTCVLVGMRSVPYVADVISGLYRPVSQKPRKSAWEQLAKG